MKRLGFFAVSAILITIGYLFPTHLLAYVTEQELANIQSHERNFSAVDSGLGSRFSSMVVSIYGRFKDDPDVNETAFRRYVFEGIPGATIPDQQGYIPYLNQIINNPASSAILVRNARILLAQSEQLTKISNINEQRIGGSVTQEQANAAMLQAGLASNAEQASAILAANPGGEKEDVSACGFSLNGNLLNCIDQLFAWLIKNTLLRLAGVILWLCANMLNFAMQVGIMDFSRWAPPALYDLWIVVRQIVSLAIVFAGLYLGFMYIIGRQDTFSRYVGWVIIFALFVNFSYPITRVLIDISNIVALNIYSSALPGALDGSSVSAGKQIMDTLGLQQLVYDVTQTEKGGDLYASIKSTPSVLVTVAFVFYAAYIFFMATAILAVRTAVLVFLTIASPLLLVDSVIPKLGEVAEKLRRMFFEQLVVAPVFVVMLAITLKFMTVFRGPSGPLASLNTGVQGSVVGASGASVGVFFGVLMMLVMLHIMLKVTRSVAGEAGNYATNVMGKVGGFGLGMATGGAGILARGTVGQVAMRARDSGWMDKMKDTKMGRGLYGLSNSLAQSTYDARNIGMVSKGLATAGLTGGLGLTMQGGSKRGFEQVAKDREERVLKFGSNIKDDNTRENYFNKANKGFVYSKVDESALAEAKKSSLKSKDEQVEKMFATPEEKDRQTLINQALIGKDYALADKLRTASQYHDIKNEDPDKAQKRADILKKLGVNDIKKAESLIDKAPFKDLKEAHEKELEGLEDEIAKLNPETEKDKIGILRKEIGNKKVEYKNQVNSLKKEVLTAYEGAPANQNADQETVQAPGADAGRPDGDLAKNGTINTLHPGGSGNLQVRTESKEYEIPAYQRKESQNFAPNPAHIDSAQISQEAASATGSTSAQAGEEKRQGDMPVFQMDAIQLIQHREKMRNLRSTEASRA